MKTTSYEIYREIAKNNGINRKTFAARVRSGGGLIKSSEKPLFSKKDITNQRFGRLVAIKFVGQDKRYNDKYLCQCDCGKSVIVYKVSLLDGRTKSCRCLSREISTKHGLSGTHLHNIWQGMKQRCIDKNSENFKKYGARGIKVCNRWIESFNNFLADMGEPKTDKHSIERIDNNGDYEPSNCRWATSREQSRNKRNNIHISYKNKTKILIEWCEHLNLPYKTIGGRIRAGWTPERAFETPIKKII